MANMAVYAFVVFEAVVLIHLSAMMRAEAIQGMELGEIARRLHDIDALAARGRERADQGAQRAVDLGCMLAGVQEQLRQFRV